MKIQCALTLIALVGMSVNAHALCVMPDGSLDDKSVSPSTVAVDMLPACESAAAPTAREAAKPALPMSTSLDVYAKAHDSKPN